MLEAWQLALLAGARRATLATIAADGRPRLVPVCFALAADERSLVMALDEKPKRVADPRELARVRDIVRDARVTLLVDRWSEDWAGLSWVRLEGRAELVEPGAGGHTEAVELLRARYSQYMAHALADRPVIRVTIGRVVGWRSS